MDITKSPVSILQERAMSLGIPLPTYNIMQDGTSFKCTVAVDKIIVTERGSNKKSAKHNAAEKAINMFIPDKVNKVLSSPKNDLSNVQNAVGKLNELCSKHCDIYPDYQDIGFANLNFIVKCCLFHHDTRGSGRTKKEAKQEAALEMLNKVKVEDFENYMKNKSGRLNPILSGANETIFEIFKQLSAGRKKTPITVADEITTKNPQVFSMKDCHNLNDLKRELKNLNFTYTISVFQRNPLILSLTADSRSENKSYTFLHSGETYEKTELDLFKKAVNGLYILLK